MGQGFAAQLGIDSANPITRAFEFDSCDIGADLAHVDNSGLRGTRERFAERVREGNISVGGTITMRPSPEDLALLFPWILGANASGTTYNVANTLFSRYITVDKVEKVCTYAGCYVNRATFSGSEGGEMRLALEVIGMTETVANAGTFPGSPTYSNTNALMFTDSVLTILGTGRSVKEWTITIDNMLDAQFYNSQTATRIVPQDRQITLACQVPYFGNTDLYGITVAGDPSTLVLTYAAYSLAFNFGALQVPKAKPTVPGRSEIMLPINGVARKVLGGPTPSLTVVLDSTP